MRRVLVVGIIVLFIGVSALPIVSSKSVSSPFEMLLEHGAESEVNDKPLDDYKEIISFIDGYGRVDKYYEILYPLFFRLSMSNGDFEIRALTRNPLKQLFYTARAEDIHIKFFAGIYLGNPEGGARIFGFAIGDITWTPYG